VLEQSRLLAGGLSCLVVFFPLRFAIEADYFPDPTIPQRALTWVALLLFASCLIWV
jgi:hypothetical protein